MLVVLCVALGACSREEAKQNAVNAKNTVATKARNAWDAAVPIGPKEDPAARERERFDERWRQLDSFRDAARPAPRPQPKAVTNLRFVTGARETFKGLAMDAINNAPISVPIQGDLSGPSVLKTQVYLDRLHFSAGVLDGRWGRNSAIALYWYQRTRGLEPTGAVDQNTFRTLASEAAAVPALVKYQLTEEDVKGPFTPIPEDVYEKAKLDCLCFESKKEKLAERFHTTTDFLESLNPGIAFEALKAGDAIFAPNVRSAMTVDQPDVARIVVSLNGNTLNGYDASDNVVFHAPTTVGSKYDPSPREMTKVLETAHNPEFHYQPTLFQEVPDSDPETTLNPGPNSPVGVVWIALSKPHFGIHGTADPDSIGYASSHGCVRLANWDAEELSHRITKGIPVEFRDTRSEQ